MSFELRDWQKNAKTTIQTALQNEPHSLVAVNACVGSGKTLVPYEAIRIFIENHNTEKTFHAFVCPTIKLCKQQRDSAFEYFSRYGTNTDLKIWNSSSTDVGQRRVIPTIPFWDSSSQHILIFICDESLWGSMKEKNVYGEEIIKCRFPRFISMLENNIKHNRLNGIIAYDESHNYINRQKNMFGTKKCLEV